jgi:hypothetical protein
MTTGRTTLNNYRIFVDGYDMSGYSRSFGPLSVTFDEGVDDAVSLSVKQTLLGNATVGMGTLNGLFDNTAASGIHVVMNGAGVMRTILIGVGIQAPPANNDPAFCGQFLQKDYYAGGGDNPITLSIPFANTSYQAGNLNYATPWGVLLHAKAAETAANSAVGYDQAAATAKGGYMCYQIIAGDGTAAIKVQDASANNDGSFSDLLTSGVINCAVPSAGIVALAPTAAVKRYVRFQVALGTASTVTFALAFCRSYI